MGNQKRFYERIKRTYIDSIESVDSMESDETIYFFIFIPKFICINSII